jgi:PqqD family protein of HPr-rel-A system
MTTTASNPRWRVPADPPPLWRTWGEESLVFNPRSGDTHLLDFAAAAGLRCLEEQPRDMDELLRALAARLEGEMDDQLAEYARRLVVHLQAAGLVERLESCE